MGLFKSIKNRLTPTGGAFYHKKAQQFAAHWTEYKVHVEAFLTQWDCGTDTLLLIGPSGGYSLPSEFLNQFKTIHAFDIDPAAKNQFFIQHNCDHLTWHNKDAFGVEAQRISTQALAKILNQYPLASVLFCNVLGQLPLAAPRTFSSPLALKAFSAGLEKLLKGRSWASYHDIFSSQGALPKDMLEKIYRIPPELVTVAQRAQGSVEFTDHLTSGLFERANNKRYFFWQITNKDFHLIEGASS